VLQDYRSGWGDIEYNIEYSGEFQGQHVLTIRFNIYFYDCDVEAIYIYNIVYI